MVIYHYNQPILYYQQLISTISHHYQLYALILSTTTLLLPTIINTTIISFIPGEESLYYPEVPTRPVSSLLQANPSLSRSVPGIPAAAQQQMEPHPPTNQKRWNLR